MQRTSKKKIVVTGALGQLGSELKRLSSTYTSYNYVFVDKDDFDLSSNTQINEYLTKENPDYIINCAAYTAVDKAESDKELANTINNLAVKTIAQWCSSNTCKLIHISTDYVFDGNSPLPYKEEDIPAPESQYGITKLEGENSAIQECPEVIIIRTAWVYSEYGNNFVKTMLKLMNDRESLNIVNDQVGSPTYAYDLAEAILKIISSNLWKPGIYHYSNEGKISWFEFAVAIKEIAGINCNLNGISAKEYPTPAKRPSFSLLDKTKIKETYNISIPEYKKSLIDCIQRLS